MLKLNSCPAPITADTVSTLLREVTEGKGRNPQLLSAFPRPPLLQVYSWDWENLLKNIFFRVFVSLFNYSTWNVVLVVYPLNRLAILSILAGIILHFNSESGDV